jgi:hypothetical protein
MVAAEGRRQRIHIIIIIITARVAAANTHLQLEYLYNFFAEPSTQVSGHVMLVRSYGSHWSEGMPVAVR